LIGGLPADQPMAHTGSDASAAGTARDSVFTPTVWPEATKFAAANQAGRTAGTRRGYSR
jgi:hypothetical protein